MLTLRNLQSFWFALALASSTIALEAPGRAGDSVPAVCVPGDPSKCSAPLEQGQPAPFQGQLLSVELAIDLGQKATYCQERVTLEVTHAKALASVDLTLEKQLRGNDLLTWQTKEKLLLERLQEAQSRPWYEHPAFVATVAVIATALLTYGSFELATHWPK